MASKTDICNFMLGHLGISKRVPNVETDQSEEAKQCRLFYDLARDQTLRGFAWPFATKFEVLGLVAVEPTTEWAYSYRYPSDCLFVRRVMSENRTDNTETREPFRLGQDDSGLLIYTDMQDAQIEYTCRVTNTNYFTPEFALAMSLYLATLTGPGLLAGDPFKLGERAGKFYNLELSRAEARAALEDRDDADVADSEMIRARD